VDPRCPNRGATILEVLVAIMLLGVLTLVVFAAFSIGMRATSLASGLEIAVGLAEEGIARLTDSPCGGFPEAAEALRSGAPGARYHREAEVRLTPENLWEVTVTVSWAQERRQRSIALTTLRHVSRACEIVGP